MDRPTLEELYREHLALVRRAIRRQGVRRSAEVEELAQDVFIVVHRKLPDLDLSSGMVKGWLYRIAVNIALNHLRRSPHRREALMDPLDQDEAFLDPGNTESHAADREQLRLLLESTTPERREVYELVELEGLTLPEVALALDIPFKTVDSRLRVARRDIQAASARIERRRTGRRSPIIPLGVGAWLHLSETTCPPPGAADRLWERIQSALHSETFVVPSTST